MRVAALRREPHDLKAYGAAWERYRALLARAVDNATISSYGRQYPAIFWLHHSLEVARLLKETPKRIPRGDSEIGQRGASAAAVGGPSVWWRHRAHEVRRLLKEPPKRILRADSEIGKRHGDAIKYRIFDRFLDRVLSTTYDLVQKVAGDTEEVEEEIFPRLLTRMRDNVLIFTEDYIGRDLAELGSYFNGSLRIDGRDLRTRIEELGRWHADHLTRNRELGNKAAPLRGGGR